MWRSAAFGATDDLLGMRWLEAQGDASFAGAESAGLSTVETYFNETNQVGVNQALEEFFNAMGPPRRIPQTSVTDRPSTEQDLILRTRCPVRPPTSMQPSRTSS